MYKNALLVLVIFLGLSQSSIAQTNFLDSPDAYLGETPPGDTPKLFALGKLTPRGTITTNRTAISGDGKEIYYCTNDRMGDYDSLKIKYFKFDGKKWVGPILLNQHLGAPAFSPDYNTLYFGDDAAMGVVLKSTRTKTGWTAPVKYIQRNYGILDFMTTASGNKYAGSSGDRGKPSEASAYQFSIFPASDADTTIQSLGTPLNSPAFNGDFFIPMDESYMVVSTNETTEFKDELYISFRRRDKTWTVPVSLGPLINDGVANRFGQCVSPDGKYLFYTRATNGTDCGVYWVRFDDLLAKLKPADL